MSARSDRPATMTNNNQTSIDLQKQNEEFNLKRQALEQERRRIEQERQALEQEQQRLEQERRRLEKETTERKIVEYLSEKKYSVARPLTKRDATISAIVECTMYSKHVELPEKSHEVHIICLPTVHMCKTHGTTEHVFLNCEFPAEYYPSCDDLDEQLQIKSENMHCLKCMFQNVGVHHQSDLKIMRRKN